MAKVEGFFRYNSGSKSADFELIKRELKAASTQKPAKKNQGPQSYDHQEIGQQSE